MRFRFFLGLLVLLASVFACTSPLVLPDDEEKKGDSTDVGSVTHPADSVRVVSLGTRADPFSVAEAQAIAPVADVWVEGVVTGYVKGTSAPSSAMFSLTDRNSVSQSNILLADTITDDYRHCIALRLASGSTERDELNLYDNPSVLHQRLKVHGSLTRYLSITGIKDVEEYVLGTDDYSDTEGGGKDDSQGGGWNPSVTPFRPNSIDEPVSVAEVVAYVDSMHTLLKADQDFSEEVWVAGFIVGYYSKSPQLGRAGSKYNVVIADSDSVANKKEVLVVKLTKGGVRDAVNLSDHPENLWRKLTVHGRVNDEYGDYPSLDNVADSICYQNGSPTFRLW